VHFISCELIHTFAVGPSAEAPIETLTAATITNAHSTVLISDLLLARLQASYEKRVPARNLSPYDGKRIGAASKSDGLLANYW
jgi:hypothetical protein